MKSFASSALRSRADDDGNRRSVLLLALHVAHPAAPPTARPPAAAAATSRAKRAVAEVAGGGGGRRGSAEDSIKAATDAEFFQTSDTRPIMLFDGVCNLCNGGVRFVREHDPNRSIRYVPLQSESGRKLLQSSGRSPDDISSVVLVEKERSYIKSEAVLRIMEYLNLPFPQLAIFLKFVPLFLRDFAYDNVANNRYTVFGRSETEACEIL
ncbi:hypothetical protein PAHAL_5G492000 [Panicum hallii]|uniref:DUF393 domain-containing protein n=1 Tax=Panicum hallii TaxID=206008 RepID=A0A2T8IP33_9POAL|nr:hypothetical protein PAHAL_5G492000 [Panicum hallii]